MTAATRIRPVEARDEADWRRLWDGFMTSLQLAPFPAARSAETFALLMEGGPHAMQGLIAEREGRAVGFVHFVVHQHGWWKGPVCFLEDLYAAPEARGLGLGRTLMETVFARARDARCTSVYWWTHADNPARALYDSLAPTPETQLVRYRHVLAEEPAS